MEQNSLKNIVVLKDLPSNIVEEAIVILKTNKKAKKVQKIEKSKKSKEHEKKLKQNEYILKEAEMLISDYITGIEEQKRSKKEMAQESEIKYRRVKNYSFITSLILLIESIYLFIK